MSKVVVDREEIEALRNTLANGGQAVAVLRWAESVLAKPAEAEGVELVPFWVLFDATTPEPLIKKHMPEGVLAFFDNEEDARRARALHPGTDYKRAPYVRAAALSAVTAERDRLRDQVKALQSDANSWQSGYDKGRHDGTKHRHSEVAQLRAELEMLRDNNRKAAISDAAMSAKEA